MNLVGSWNFEDGTANDASGNAHHGILKGNARVVDDPVRGMVLGLTGNASDYVDCGNHTDLDLNGGPYTIAVWFKVNSWDVDDYTPIIAKGAAYRITQYSSTNYLRHYTGNHGSMHGDSVNVNDGAWHHAAAVYDGTTAFLYIDGNLDASTPSEGASSSTYILRIGSISGYDYRSFNGLIDDVFIYKRSMSQTEISRFFVGSKASNPHPADGAANVPVDALLRWTAGSLAAATNGHEVYWGTDFQEVYDRAMSTRMGFVNETNFDPRGLDYSTNYYWAIDEVNDSQPGSPWPGGVWSFSTESESNRTEGYYKGLFMDSGINLTSRKTLPSADLLGLSMEYLAAGDGDEATQRRVMIGSSTDENGRLLYPDGGPRFRCVYVNGGASTNHGASLGEDGRQRYRDFYLNGGSYTGSCAGAFFASMGPDSDRAEYLHIWPGYTRSTALTKARTGHAIPAGSPLLNYYDFGGDNYVADVYHNGGCDLIENDDTYWATGTEVLARYALPVVTEDTSWREEIIGNVSAWAYKKDAQSGRLCPIGSHPEGVVSGERLDYMASLLRYAMDGQGGPSVKSSLQNGVTRVMYDNGIPNREKIGDWQYHHYTIEVPTGMTQLSIALDGDDFHDFNLYARKGLYAFDKEVRVIAASNTRNSNESLLISNPEAGTWYIGVKCAETVTAALQPWGLDYVDNHEVLNGLAYEITASWDAPVGDMNADGKADKWDLHVLMAHWGESTLYPRRPWGEIVSQWKFDEITGALAYDASGKNHRGTLHGGPLWRPGSGKFSGALSFDEINDCVSVDDFDYTNGSDEFTLSFWFKIDDASGTTYQYMFSHGAFSANNSLNVYLRESAEDSAPDKVSTCLELANGNTWNSNSPNQMTDGQWHMYAITLSSVDGAKIYIDGELIAGDPNLKGAAFNPVTDIFIGGRSDQNAYRFYGHSSEDDGLLDDTRIYCFALTADEIKAVYAGSAVLSPALKLVWSTILPGDLNEDGVVDYLDLLLLAEGWSR
jgi:Concanavalin A-like lectin/glucanases superfamily/Bacterial pre-peptidase C-terminal domain/Biotin-protein ligase, N terminal